jgi:hypothetical protein
VIGGVHSAKSRVARWFIFIQKNHNLGKFWMALNGKAIFYARLEYFATIWDIL